MSERPELPVIFRMYRGELTAYFPTVQWSDNGEIACYAHVGQHSGASTAWLSKGKRATQEQYKDLLSELKRIYEDCDPEDNPVKLVVYKRAVGKANTRNMGY